MNIAKLRITSNSIERRIRDAAISSSNVVFVPPLEMNSMGGMMTYHQALKCLRNGSVIGKPTLNEHGHWQLEMQRYAANHMFSLKVVAVCDGPRVVQIFAFPMGEGI